MRPSTCLFSSSGLVALALLAGCGVTPADAATDEASVVARDAVPLAADLPEHCSSPEVLRIDRPVDKDDASRGRFSYGFRFKAPTTAGAPVLVYLPGGPGSASTTEVPDFLPEGWGYLLTDPRGVGCNTPATLPSEDVSSAFFKTEEIAADVVAAIQSRDLQDYVLFGISYGTMLGTVVAHELEAQKLTAPKAVVLEGVLGRAFTSEFVAAESIRQWDRIRGVLPADVLEELDTKEEPYGISQDGWSRAIAAFMPAGPAILANQVGALSTTLGLTEEQRAGALEGLKAAAQPDPSHSSPGAVELYRQVACREIADTVPASDLDTIFQRGKVVRNMAEDGTKCRGLRLKEPFDSAKFQFSTKTFYFIGEDDVATPAWQGAYHFEKHKGSAVRVVTLKAGHNSLEYDQAACAPQLLTSIAAGASDLQAVLATCPKEVQVDSK
jgi:pimeloyl-ACP methyl ester carboxylesterase